MSPISPPTRPCSSDRDREDALNHYRAYGLTIASELPLPELVAEPIGDAPPAIVIRRGRIDGERPSAGAPPIARFAPDRAFFAWSALGRFVVDGDGAILVDADPGVDDALVNTVVLGPLMATILHRRGYPVLHGSAIAVAPGKAILFLGDKGAGKSTLAAEFVAAGYRLINDDVIALRVEREGAVRILPGPPLLKLSLAAIDALPALPATMLPMARLDDPKRRLRFADAPEGEAAVAAIYILNRGDTTGAERLDPAAALSGLMRHSYMFKFGMEAFSAAAAASQFMACGMIADRIGASSLTVTEGFARLSEVRAAVKQDFETERTIIQALPCV